MKDLYEHLRSFGLYKKRDIARRLHKFPRKKIDQFFNVYLESVQNRAFQVAEPWVTDIYPDSWRGNYSISLIRQLALYANRIYIHDPLGVMYLDWLALDINPANIVLYKSEEDRLRLYASQLAKVIEILLEIEPLVKAGIVHIPPTEFFHNPRHPGMIYADDMYGVDPIPLQEVEEDNNEAFLIAQDYLTNNIIAHPAKYIDNQLVVLEEPLITPCRIIGLEFSDKSPMKVYHFGNIQDFQENPETGQSTFNVVYDIHGNIPIDEDLFRNWVSGSSKKFARERLQRLVTDINIAARSQAVFLTNLPLTRDLLLSNIDEEYKIREDKITKAALNLRLPFFERVSFEDIVRARKNDLAFSEFREALEKAFAQIGDIADENDLQEKIDEVVRDVLYLPLKKIDNQVESFKRSLALDSAILLGTLSTTIFTGLNPLSITASALAAGKALETYKKNKEEEDKLKQLPSFFYWDLTRNTRRNT